jgi:hypothetical protein
MIEEDPKDQSPDAQTLEERQSTADITRGAERLLIDMDMPPLREFSLATGRRIDLAAIAKNGSITFVEVKSSLADFRSDQKWSEYLEYCDQFYFAVAPDFPMEVLPQNHGLIIADRYGGAVMREDADAKKIVAARRKSVTLRFARVAAARIAYQQQSEESAV